MTRGLRGAWSRRGTLLSLIAMTTVVVAGAVGVLGFAEAAGTSRWLTAPLLLLGAVAVPGIGRELALARREEIGLARLRGIRGLRLAGVLLAEPLVTILLGTALGLGLGSLVARTAGQVWLDAGAAGVGSAAVHVALGTAAGSLLIVLIGTWSALGEPLSLQVAARARPRRATTPVAFGSVLVIVGGVVAAYRIRALGDGEPDALVLLGPALVGLALGQISIWVLRLVARSVAGATGATGRSGLAGFLATRRLTRADDLVTSMRLLVAAAVVGVLALTGATSVSDWADTEARVAAGGAVRVPVESGAGRAMSLSHSLDPQGRHLMAAAIVPNEDRLAERRAYVDAARFAVVAGDFHADTPAAEAAALVPELATDSADLSVVGNRLTVASRLLEQGRGLTTGLVLQVDYVTQDDTGASVEATLTPRPGEPDDRRSVGLSGCAAGCQVTGLAIGRLLEDGGGGVFAIDDTTYRVLLTDLSVGDRSLLDIAWAPDRAAIEAFGDRSAGNVDLDFRPVVDRSDGLEVHPLPGGLLDLTVAATSEPIPELAAGAEPGRPLDVSGNERVLGEGSRVEALPLLGAVGQLTDLPTSMLGAGPTVPDAQAWIVVADGTPDELLRALTDATGTDAQSLEDVRRSVIAAAGADQSRTYALMAVFCALVALLALAAGVARHLRSHRHDVASLRVLGVGLGAVRRAGRVELAALAAVVALAVAAGGGLAVVLLLDGLPLVTVPPAGSPLDTDPRWSTLAGPAGLAALAMLLVGGRGRAVHPTATRPSTLREEEGR